MLTNRVYNHLRCIQNPHLPGSLLGKEDAAVQDWLPFISPFIVFGTAPPWLEPAASAAGLSEGPASGGAGGAAGGASASTAASRGL